MLLKRVRRMTINGLLAFLLSVSMSGCVYLVIGGLGAVGGYVVSPDTVEGILTDVEYSEAWDAVEEIVSIMGVIEEKDQSGGILVSRINGARVTITVFKMSASAIKLNVKARKSFFPRIGLAQDVYVKITNFLS